MWIVCCRTQESGGILGSLGVTLKSLSAESVNTVRDATAPLLQVANQTVLEARSTLQDLGGDVALAVVRARASGWDAAHCAQGKSVTGVQPLLVMRSHPQTLIHLLPSVQIKNKRQN